MTIQDLERILAEAASFRQSLPPVPTMVTEKVEQPATGGFVRHVIADGTYQLSARDMNALLDCVRALYKEKHKLAPVGWAILVNAAKVK